MSLAASFACGKGWRRARLGLCLLADATRSRSDAGKRLASRAFASRAHKALSCMSRAQAHAGPQAEAEQRDRSPMEGPLRSGVRIGPAKLVFGTRALRPEGGRAGLDPASCAERRPNPSSDKPSSVNCRSPGSEAGPGLAQSGLRQRVACLRSVLFRRPRLAPARLFLVDRGMATPPAHVPSQIDHSVQTSSWASRRRGEETLDNRQRDCCAPPWRPQRGPKSLGDCSRRICWQSAT